MARELSIQLAINEALDQEMQRDPTVVLLGEDIAGGSGAGGEEDAWGGPLGVTKGLKGKYPNRVLDTPITESAFVGAAIGAAASGVRPVAELMFIDFLGVCFDQVYNQAAKFRFMFGGKARTPVVIRTMYGGGLRAAAQHSQSLYPILTHVPGLKVVLPSNAYDAKGLLIQSIRDDDPVVFCEHKAIYTLTSEVPEEPYAIPLGVANVVREGGDATLVAVGALVHTCARAAETLAGEGVDCEVIDLRCTSPLDEEAIYRSVEKTGHLIVVDESYPRCGLAADIVSLVARNAFDLLDGPPQAVTPPHAPSPFAPPLEDLYLPSADRVADAVRSSLGLVAAAAR